MKYEKQQDRKFRNRRQLSEAEALKELPYECSASKRKAAFGIKTRGSLWVNGVHLGVRWLKGRYRQCDHISLGELPISSSCTKTACKVREPDTTPPTVRGLMIPSRRPTTQVTNEATAATAALAAASEPDAPLPPLGPPGVLVAYYADHWRVPLPPGHRFPMEKYAATHGSLKADHSLEGLIQLRAAPAVSMEDVTLAHDVAYVERFRYNRMTDPEMRNVGFPWSEQLVGRTFASCGGTVAAMHVVMQQGGSIIAGNIAGGTHHAFRDRVESLFLCILTLDSILVVDLDVHQGNGTADIFQDDPRVTTFDIFGDKNYPWKTRRKNTYDIPLLDDTGDEQYVALLRSWLPKLMREHRPQLIMFQAGVDALRGDSFGRLGMTRSGLLARNNLVYGTALEAGVPLVITMGGGYTRPMDASVHVLVHSPLGGGVFWEALLRRPPHCWGCWATRGAEGMDGDGTVIGLGTTAKLVIGNPHLRVLGKTGVHHLQMIGKAELSFCVYRDLLVY
ncbi:hypothetical protein VOLCADRAFT_91828 [Volvox carteri f. nagariensis]|uniref:Histone deacetylase domain-containing protein n=1 Tax=Volvox carteri f. nagariensis TaxID=3068 RepID=D8TY23_VOLCA|nr:uncharacterized protein VOLCADRAFT_91828 [Volvox carteri f. nagariensis]EFJ47569.1 hypothetical protein VOLCADRAFT_91828 [Volvox carteri f. nagariensis]|eukprot:XP_002951393.1 hypothetical protein VOLCADRAFT_91828 [Volvox carteri f. nagariensis]